MAFSVRVSNMVGCKLRLHRCPQPCPSFLYAPGPQNSLDHGNAPLHRHMLSLDDATNFIEHFVCTFIVGDKQALQN
jgi:hypothetical protein